MRLPRVSADARVDRLVDDCDVSATLVDTTGEEDYDRARAVSYPQADVFLLCYSIASPATLASVVTKWHPELLYYCPSVPIVLLGTDAHLRDDRETTALLASRTLLPITIDEALKVGLQINAVKVLECSYKTAVGLDAAFNEAYRAVLRARGVLSESHPPRESGRSLLATGILQCRSPDQRKSAAETLRRAHDELSREVAALPTNARLIRARVSRYLSLLSPEKPTVSQNLRIDRTPTRAAYLDDARKDLERGWQRAATLDEAHAERGLVRIVAGSPYFDDIKASVAEHPKRTSRSRLAHNAIPWLASRFG